MLGPNKLLGALSVLEKKALRIQPRQCTRTRHRRSNCSRCTDACPHNAIYWSPELQINDSLCNGCGLCAAVCPTGAIEAQAPSNVELVARARDIAPEDSAVAFACPSYLKERKVSGRACIQVSCLGRLDDSVLVGAAAWGGRDLLLVDGACEGCPEHKGRVLAEEAAEKAKELLLSRGAQFNISFVNELPSDIASRPRSEAAGADVSRRSFFGVLAGRAKQAGVITIGTVLPEVKPTQQKLKPGEFPIYVPARR